jgi:hypothetical protein
VGKIYVEQLLTAVNVKKIQEFIMIVPRKEQKEKEESPKKAGAK